jgi:hypothetical protein
MIVINFIFKVIFKTLLLAIWLWPITLPLGYCVAVGMALGWDNMREAGVGLMLILPAIVVFYILRWDYRRGGGDGKFNTILDEDNYEDYSPSEIQGNYVSGGLDRIDGIYFGFSHFEADHLEII